MNKPRIVHFTSSLKRGGAEGILYSLVAGLQDSFEQTVLYIHDGPYRHKLDALGIKCIKISGVFHTYDPGIFIRLYRELRRIRPHLMHTLLWAATVTGRVVGRLLAIPVVSIYHGNVDQDGLIRNIADRYTLSLSKNGAVSPGVVKSIHTCLAKVPVMVIPNGIACKELSASVQRSDLGLDRAHFVVGSVGRLVKIKRFDVLLDAFMLIYKAHPEARLCLIGVGPELENLQEQARRLGVFQKVLFLVDVPAVDYYHLFDCFVLPSPREGISIALLEAMRARVPVVVVCQEQHPVVQHEHNGLVALYADAAEIMHAIDRLMRDEVEAHRLADEGLKVLNRSFNRNVMISKYSQLFHAEMRH